MYIFIGKNIFKTFIIFKKNLKYKKMELNFRNNKLSLQKSLGQIISHNFEFALAPSK